MTHIHAPVWTEGSPGEHMAAMQVREKDTPIFPYSVLCTVCCVVCGMWCVVCQLCPILLTYTSFSPYIFTGLYSHMAAMQSKDQGRTWSDFVPIEPYSNTTTAQVSAYGSIVASGDGSRVFSLWIQNVNDVQNLPGKPPSKSFRADMLGR